MIQKINLRSSSTLLLGVVLASTSCLQQSSRSAAASVDNDFIDFVEEQAPRKASGWQLGDPGSRFEYSPLFERKFFYSDYEYGVDVFTKELWDGVWYTWQKSFSTSFGIELIRGSSSEEYVVGGFDELTGETVLEGWKFTTPSGGYAALRNSESIEPIGVPCPITTLEIDLVDSIFVAPSDREVVSPPQKRVLFRGSGIRIDNFIADPEGRFLIIHDRLTNRLYQLRNQQLFLIADPQEFPILVKAKNLEVYQDSNTDRVLVVRASGTPPMLVVLYDSDNDGMFETITEMNEIEFNETFPFYWVDESSPPSYEIVR